MLWAPNFTFVRGPPGSRGIWRSFYRVKEVGTRGGRRNIAAVRSDGQGSSFGGAHKVVTSWSNHRQARIAHNNSKYILLSMRILNFVDVDIGMMKMMMMMIMFTVYDSIEMK